MKNIIKKFITAIIFAAVISSIMAGCASSKQTASKNPPVSEIETSIGKTVDFSNMVKLDDKKLKKLYGIESADLDGYFAYIASSNIKADTVLVMKVKDSSNVNIIKDKVKNRIDEQKKTFESYLPVESDRLQKGVLKTSGDYVFCVVSDNNSKIEDTFDKELK